eukprot:gene22417-29529_t
MESGALETSAGHLDFAENLGGAPGSTTCPSNYSIVKEFRTTFDAMNEDPEALQETASFHSHSSQQQGGPPPLFSTWHHSLQTSPPAASPREDEPAKEAWSDRESTRESVRDTNRESIRESNSQGSQGSVLPSINGARRGVTAPGPAPGTMFRNTTTFNQTGLGTLRTDATLRNLRSELLSLRNRAAIEIQGRDSEILGLRKLVGEQRETIESMRDQMKKKNNALKDLVRVEDVQLRACSKVNSNADAKLKELTDRIRDMKKMHAKALDRARDQIEFAKKERNALCAAMASLANTALGGGEGDGADVQQDQQAAMAYAGENLSKNPSAWLGLKYHAHDGGQLANDGGQLANDGGQLVSMSKKAGTPQRPFDNDGARAVETLSRQVARLWNGRANQKARAKEIADQLLKAQDVLDAINADFEVVNLMLDRVQEEGGRMSAMLGDEVSERFAIVDSFVNGLVQELLVTLHTMK